MKILMVDDEKPLLDQAGIYLKRLIDGIEVVTETDAKIGLKRLEEQEFDAIISDYQMPEMNGLDFLEVIRHEKGYDHPFIIFTGKGREEVAMEALNLGADRYLQKGGDPRSQYSVLSEAIKQEVDRKEAKEELVKLSSMVKNSSEAMICTDKKFRITCMNEPAEDMFGYSFEKVKGRESGFLIAEPEKAKIQDEIYDMVTSGQTYKGVHLNKTEDGHKFYCEMKVSPIYDDEGEIKGYISSQRDITNRKEAEEKIGHLNSLLKAVRNINKIMVQGESLSEIMQDACEYLVGARSYLECTIGLLDERSGKISPVAGAGRYDVSKGWYVTEDGEGDAPSCMTKSIRTGDIEVTETDGCNKGEGVYSIADIPMKRYDKVVGVIHIGLQKQAKINGKEKELLEEVANDLAYARAKILSERDLEMTKDRLELAMDVSDHGFWDWDLENDKIFFSSKCYDMLDYDPDDLPNGYDVWKSLIHPEDEDKVFPDMIKEIKNSETFEKEFRMKTKSGDWKWISAIGRSYKVDDDDKPQRVIGTHVDIDERKRKEQLIKDSREKYKRIFEESPHAIWEEDYSEVKNMISKKKREVEDLEKYLDEDEDFLKRCIKNVKILDLNKKAVEMYGSEDKEDFQNNLDEVMTKKSLELFKKILVKISEGGTYIEGEDVNRTPSGKKIHVFVTWKVVPEHEQDYSRVYVSKTDITDRIEAEKVLIETKERYESLFKQSNDAIFIHDLDGKIIDVNEVAEELFCLPREKLIGKCIKRFTPEDQMEKVKKALKETKDKGSTRFQTKFITDKEDEKYVDISSRLIDQKEGIVQGIARDITDRKKMQKRLTASEKKFRKAFESSPDLSILIDEGGICQDVNEITLRKLGYEEEELIGKTLPQLPFMTDGTIQKTNEKMENDEPLPYEIEFLTKEGDVLYVELNAGSFEEVGESSFDGEVIVARDITQRKKAEERFKLFFENLGDAIFVTKVGGEDFGEIFEVNPAAVKQTGYSHEELLGMNIAKNLSIMHPKEFYKKWDEKLVQGETVKALDKKKTKDGTEYWTEVVTTPIEYEGKQASLSINRDVTEKKGSQEREELLHSVLRHDIKNKAQIVQGYLQLLEDKELSEDTKEFIQKALKANEESISLIQKIRLLLGAQREKKEAVKVGSTIHEAVDSTRSLLSDKGMDISMSCSSMEYGVQGGPLLKEVFTNIIENSAYHSEGNTVKISGEVTEDEVVCIIEDDGKGIPDDKKETIFNKGYTTDKGRGTGLGMFLVKMLLETYGGSIEVKDSKLGGARFEVLLKKV